jgi:hypothetical protein
VSGARGQASIEAVVSIPLCVVCALGIVSAGLYVRQQMAVSHAAARAGAAQVSGLDPQAAAKAALPPGAKGVRVVRGGRASSQLTVSEPTSAGLFTPFLPSRISSSVAVDVPAPSAATGGDADHDAAGGRGRTR